MCAEGCEGPHLLCIFRFNKKLNLCTFNYLYACLCMFCMFMLVYACLCMFIHIYACLCVVTHCYAFLFICYAYLYSSFMPLTELKFKLITFKKKCDIHTLVYTYRQSWALYRAASQLKTWIWWGKLWTIEKLY